VPEKESQPIPQIQQLCVSALRADPRCLFSLGSVGLRSHKADQGAGPKQFASPE
jgi:hypothetical protein